jgi:hypothetical protein
VTKIERKIEKKKGRTLKKFCSFAVVYCSLIPVHGSLFIDPCSLLQEKNLIMPGIPAGDMLILPPYGTISQRS